MRHAAGARTAAAYHRVDSRRRADARRQSLLPAVDDRARQRDQSPRAAAGLPDRLPMPRAFTGAYSPDGRRMAYEDVSIALFAEWAQEQSSQWRHYRGGRTHPIRVIDLGDHAVEKLPWTDSNDTTPDVGRRHHLLPLRPQRHDQSVQLRPAHETGRAAHAA